MQECALLNSLSFMCALKLNASSITKSSSRLCFTRCSSKSRSYKLPTTFLGFWWYSSPLLMVFMARFCASYEDTDIILSLKWVVKAKYHKFVTLEKTCKLTLSLVQYFRPKVSHLSNFFLSFRETCTYNQIVQVRLFIYLFIYYN